MNIIGNGLIFIGGGGMAPSRLLNGLVSYWNFDEASGTRADALGVNDLDTAYFGSGFSAVPGIIGNALYDSNGSSIGTAGNFVPPPGSFTFALWVNHDAITALDLGRVTVGQLADPSLHFWFMQGEGSFLLRVSSDNASAVDCLSTVPLSAGVPYFVVFYYDDVNHLIGISVNDGAPDTVAFTGPIYQGGPGVPLLVGNYKGHNGPPGLLGWVDEMGYWSRMLGSSERTELYNSGNGVTYPFTGMQAANPFAPSRQQSTVRIIELASSSFWKRHTWGMVGAGIAVAVAIGGALYFFTG